MNLYNNPSLNELRELISACGNTDNNYKVLVDFDGEVMIEPYSKSEPVLKFYKFKFFFKEILQGKASVGPGAAKNDKWINHIYKNLIFSWQEDLKGAIAQNDLHQLQSLSAWEKASTENNDFTPLATVMRSSRAERNSQLQ